MKYCGIIVLSVFSILSFSCSSGPQAGSEGDVTATLLLKDYRPVSVFKLPEHKPDQPKFTVIDMHSHDYLEDEEGVKGWAKLLDEQNIERVVVNTMGHGDEFERIYDLYKGISDKFELWCGFNMERWGEDDFVETALADLQRCYEKGAKGVGELGDKGLGEQYCVNRSFTDCVPTAHFNDPLFAPLFDKCGELGMPVNIHIGDPIWMYEPIDEHNDGLMNAAHWAIDLSTPGILDLDELVDTFLETVEKHPKTTFIAAHLLNYNHDYAKLGAILDAHPNLYIDISARHAETAVTPRATAAFYKKYQDRIVFGTDNDPSPRMYKLNWRILETEDEHIYAGSYHWPLFGLGLSDEVLHKIYHDNAVKIMGY